MHQKRSDQMGSVSLKIGDGTARFRRSSTLCSSLVHLIMLTSVLITNLFALYAFTYSPPPTKNQQGNNNENLLTHQISSILHEISLSERKLHQMERDLSGFSNLDPTSPNLPPELRSFLARHPLPLGRDSRSGMTELVSSISHSCVRSSGELLRRFMSYKPHSICPSSDNLTSDLISLGCDPIPRRRCLTKGQERPFPPPPSYYYSWFTKPRGKNDFSPQSIAALLPPGTGRIAFDFHAPAADFASAMSAHNVTVVTSSPFGVTDGALGLVMGPGQRFPFYDNVFDLVHTVKGLLDKREEAAEFLMFDIDRVLRPGGLFWLDNLYCADDERKRSVTRLIEKFGYKKLKWVIGERAAGAGTSQVYLSAVLQKPVRG